MDLRAGLWSGPFVFILQVLTGTLFTSMLQGSDFLGCFAQMYYCVHIFLCLLKLDVLNEVLDVMMCVIRGPFLKLGGTLPSM